MRTFLIFLVFSVSFLSLAEESYSTPFDDDQNNHTTDTRRYKANAQSLNLDLQGNVSPSYEGRTNRQIIGPALNYLVNQLGHNGLPGLCTLKDEEAESLLQAWTNGGTFTPQRWNFRESSHHKYPVTRNIVSQECIDWKAFEVLTESYPYGCKGNNAYRLDWLIYRLMTASVYQKTNRLPQNQDELEKALGTRLLFTNHNLRRDYIKFGIVTKGERVITIPKSIGLDGRYGRTFGDKRIAVPGAFTFDFNKENKPSPERNVQSNPLNPHFDAIEGFPLRINGLWDYMVFDLNGNKLLEAAPGGVADFTLGLTASREFKSVRAHDGYNSVRNVVDCMICHMEGIISSNSESNNSSLIKNLKEFAARERGLKELADKTELAYSSSEELAPIEDARSFMKTNFQEALTAMGVMEKGHSVPLLPDFHAFYLEPVNLSQLARELGKSFHALKTTIEADSMLRFNLGIGQGEISENTPIERTLVESMYCEILSKLDPSVKYEPRKPEHPKLSEDAPQNKSTSQFRAKISNITPGDPRSGTDIDFHGTYNSENSFIYGVSSVGLSFDSKERYELYIRLDSEGKFLRSGFDITLDGKEGDNHRVILRARGSELFGKLGPDTRLKK